MPTTRSAATTAAKPTAKVSTPVPLAHAHKDEAARRTSDVPRTSDRPAAHKSGTQVARPRRARGGATANVKAEATNVGR